MLYVVDCEVSEIQLRAEDSCQLAATAAGAVCDASSSSSALSDCYL